MKQAAAKKFSDPSPIFNVIKGLLFDEKESSDNLVDIAWQFAYSTLWNNHVFSSIEKNEAKVYIKEWLAKSKKPDKAFINFCQRIILARQNIHALNTDYLSLPSLWFDLDNGDGFAITKEWLYELKAIRHSLPQFKIEVKALAEAVLEFSEEPTSENFQYWRNYFIDRQEPILLNIYTVFCANQQFNIH
jgi:hypothetical protein